jgi:hypothetical protein
VNGDGIPDVVSAGPNGIYISYGHADGNFGSAPAYEATEVIGYATVADFNGDGIPDVVASGDANIKVSLGKGDGTFAAPVAAPNGDGALNFGTPLSATGAHIAHGDFNGDGKLDGVAIGSSSIYAYNAYLLLGNGDGTIQSPVLVPDSSTLYPMFSQLTDAAVYDVNHDGRSDLVSVSQPSTTGPYVISVALSNGDGSFRAVTTASPSELQTGGGFYYPITLPALANFFGHGQLDAAYGSLSHVYILKGHGDGTFDQAGTAMMIPRSAAAPASVRCRWQAATSTVMASWTWWSWCSMAAGSFPFPAHWPPLRGSISAVEMEPSPLLCLPASSIETTSESPPRT